jgi:hypothetical protein
MGLSTVPSAENSAADCVDDLRPCGSLESNHERSRGAAIGDARGEV